MFDLHGSCKLEATKCLSRDRNTILQVELYSGLFKEYNLRKGLVIVMMMMMKIIIESRI